MLRSTERSYHKEYSCEYQSSSTRYSNVINKNKVFKKQARLQGQSQGQKSWFPWKGSVTRKTHVKY